MANVFRSGAFLRQCFSVHPLSLTVKLLTLPDTVGIACRHCKSRHRLTIGAVTHLTGNADTEAQDAAAALAACVAGHRDALHVTDVCVERDIVQFRCRECRTGVHVAVSKFETCQP